MKLHLVDYFFIGIGLVIGGILALQIRGAYSDGFFDGRSNRNSKILIDDIFFGTGRA